MDFLWVIIKKKGKKKTLWPTSYCNHFLHVSVSPLLAAAVTSCFSSSLALRQRWHTPAPLRLKPNPPPSRESNRHRFVPSPSGSQTTADNINCFPGRWQLSARRHRDTLKLNSSGFSWLLNTEALLHNASGRLRAAGDTALQLLCSIWDMIQRGWLGV